MATTALPLITRAFTNIGVLGQGTPVPSADQSADGLARLNQMITDEWQTAPRTLPFVARLLFAMVAGQGDEANPYTIGPGGDFDTARPMKLEGSGVLYGGLPETPTSVEIPRATYTDDGYEAIQLKALQNALPTGTYYRPTYNQGLGTIITWPVANTNANAFVLYIKQPIATFANLTTSYWFPPGATDALEYGLSFRLCDAYGVPDATADRMEKKYLRALGAYKRSTARLSDVPTDAALTGDRRGTYNIQTGNL